MLINVHLIQGKEEVYKQLLQDPELVLENLVDRAISSKNQVVMYTEVYGYSCCKMVEKLSSLSGNKNSSFQKDWLKLLQL